jgi:type II secretory pathway predicted ATPase ExeA
MPKAQECTDLPVFYAENDVFVRKIAICHHWHMSCSIERHRHQGAEQQVSIRIPAESPFERANRADGGAGLSLGPVRLDPRSNGLTYEPFYGFREKPFSLTSDSRFFYHSRSHAPAFADLVAGIRRRESLNVLSGDIGTGKTTLCRAVLQNLDRKTFSAFVPDPFASREDLLKILLVDFGVVSVDDLTSGRLKNASRTELSYVLYEFLGTLAPLQAFAVVIIDEAQNLSIPLLEEIRILSDADGQLQVVLVGQLQLQDKLALPEMRQVDQRVSVHCTLEPLECEGVAGYIDHRIYAAGGTPDRVKFTDDAVERIYQLSDGVPRIINRLCDRALQHGYLQRVGTIDRAILSAANGDVVPAARPAAPRVMASRTEPLPPPAPPLSPMAPPSPDPVEHVDPVDPVDMWLEDVDERTAAPRVPAKSTGASADLSRPDRLKPPTPNAPIHVPQARPGFLLRPDAPRTALQMTTDRWLRRLGIVTFAVMAVGGSLLGAPTMIDLGNGLVRASTSVLEAPEPLGLPSTPSVKLAPSIVIPATPDISADVTFATGQ